MKKDCGEHRKRRREERLKRITAEKFKNMRKFLGRREKPRP
jgi:hypothetical protein